MQLYDASACTAAATRRVWCTSARKEDLLLSSDVVLVSRRLEDKITSLGLGLDKKVLSILKSFSSLLVTNNHDIIV